MSNKHVVVFPLPYGSHPLPVFKLLLELARSAPSVSFSFISTEKSNQTLFSNIQTPNNVKHYSISDGIPKGHVQGSDPLELVNLFLNTDLQNFQNGIDLAVADTKKQVTCIIADALVVTPTFTIATALNVPWIPVWLAMSCSLSVHIYDEAIRQHCSNSAGSGTIDFLPGLPMISAEDLPREVLTMGTEKETVLARALASLATVLPEAMAVVMNFFEELDPPLFVQDMRSKSKSMLYVPLTLLTTPIPPSDTDGRECLSWLDMQKARSVVYVSFGSSGAIPPQHELVALAEALEDGEFPYIWSLKDNLKDILPKGFLERTSMHGKLMPWAPQAEILAHGSVGVFVTHCGCNSVTEGISNAVPMICRPLFVEQGINGILIETVWKNGMMIEGRVFTKNALLKSLNLILLQEEGKKFRENALKLQKIAQEAVGPKGRSTQDFKTLVELISSS